MFKNLRIKERLTRSFVMVSAITAVAAVVGMIAMLVMSNRYSYALTNYGFSQGDIGKALVTFADTRSATRAVISYTEDKIIAEALATHDQKKTEFDSDFDRVAQTLTTPDEKKMYSELETVLEDYWKLDASILELGNTTDEAKSKQAQLQAAEQLDPMYDQVYTQLYGLMSTNVEQGNQLSSTLSTLSIVLLIVIIAVIVIAMVISMWLGSQIAKGIAIPLGALSDRLKTFARGELSEPFPEVDSKDEVAEMSREAKFMAENLNLLINDVGELLGKMAEGNYAVQSQIGDKYTGDFIKLKDSMKTLRDQMTVTLRSIEEASSQVSAGSGNLAEASQSLAEGATDQAGAVEELQATITNITDSIQKGAENAEGSYAQAKKYAEEADNSREEMKAMVDAMGRINETSKKIENIISEIEDIASQTNLLSLNASIEAARAGEAGRGFAVVADQIRQLAEQSTKSAVDTRELIEGSLQEILEGNRAAERAASSIEEVVDGIKQIAEASKQMSAMSGDQAVAMRQAEEGVSQISEVVQSNSATAEESSATSEELSAQAVALDELISKFILQ